MKLRISACAVVCAGVLLSTILRSADARPGDGSSTPLPEDASHTSPSASGISSLSSHVFTDTVTYGGTTWAPDSLRWEALRDSHWTFDSGVGTEYGPTGPNKPAGYHTRMEGWFGIDQTLNPLPYFRRSATCAINGSWSLWAGVTLTEANALCYTGGQGYGNNWNLEVRKTLSVASSGNAVLSYKFAADVEPGFDYGYVLIDTTGTGAAADVVLATYDGLASGIASIDLIRGMTLRTTAGDVVLKFTISSDGSYSDEDGLYPSTCGAFAVDDVSLTGSIVDFSDFESGSDGWIQPVPSTGIGDFSNIVNRNTDLPPTTTFCACGVRDSVLVFHDELYGHPDHQDNIAASPWIDLKRGGDSGRPGKLMLYDVYAEMPLANYVFVQLRARWYPSICGVTGLLFTTPFRDMNTIFYYGEAPYCNAPGTPQFRDYSAVIEPGAEQVQLGIGMLSLCATAPFGPPCTGVTNTTPWLDNIGLGVYGPRHAPMVTVLTFDFLQDNFAADGTTNPGSTARLDSSTIKNGSTPGFGTILRDTLVARGDGGNTEVRLVFRVRPGPWIHAASLAAHVPQWTPEPSLGAGWYSARMDTAEQGGIKAAPITWMATYHESDPGFSGTDRTPDPTDPSQLENEILPDHVFTPGSRIDYFVTSRYLPPDPRNPGVTNWWVVPDTTGGRYFEVEILPSSMAADSTWNCTLYVDHHHDRDLEDQMIEEQGLKAALGVGGKNAEGTRYDRFDSQTPSSGQMSFGRPYYTQYGASLAQISRYKNIIWHSGSLSSLQLTDEDASVIGPWLTLRGIGNNRFWGSGSGLATSMHIHDSSTQTFMRNILGALRTCNTVRDAACPTGTSLDTTYCLPLSAVAGSEFPSLVATSARGNGCPELLSFDLLDRNPAVATSKGQLNYMKNGLNTAFASVTNFNTMDVDYKTVLDGMPVGRLRTTPATPHTPALCTMTTAATARTSNVLDWFGSTVTCRFYPCPGCVSVPAVDPVRYRAALGNAYPNPMNPTTRIQFTNGVEGGRVTLRIFDVTGRLVRILHDAPLPAGIHEIAWDGRSAEGSEAPSGMYFYRMTAGDYEASRKLVIMK